jgi:DeoR/GlpR family transcriptional regulator of sugar metabolism
VLVFEPDVPLSSSGASSVAQALADRADVANITVFTSSLTIALALEPAHPRVSVVVTGGTLRPRPRQHSLVQPLAGMVLRSINARKAFIGGDLGEVVQASHPGASAIAAHDE